jgi:large subunit ribosomal protein L35
LSSAAKGREVVKVPKMKSNRAATKRFKVTASGKVKHRKAFRGHKLSHKTGKRKRQLRQDGVITGADAIHVVEGLRPIL